MIGGLVILIILILAIAIVASCIKIVPQAQAYVVERLGAYQDTWSVGLHFKVPIVDKVATAPFSKKRPGFLRRSSCKLSPSWRQKVLMDS